MMNKKRLRNATIIVTTAILISQFPAAVAKAAPPRDGSWTLLPASSDEFDGTCLDESGWTNGIWYDVSSELAFHPDNVSVENGNLVLSAKKQPYKDKNYTIGSVESKFEVPGTASYVEVRAKALDKRANVLSAIWMQSSPLNSGLNPNPEIDIMETFDFSQMTSTLHTWHQNPSLHFQMGTKRWDTGLKDISEDYHTYALERRNGKLRFYFDGQLTWERTSIEDSFVELSRHMVLSLEGHLGIPNDEYIPGVFLVDYVRTYYDSDFAGVPEDGTYQIINRQSGKALALPDGELGEKPQLVQKECGNADAWTIAKQDDGTIVIINAANSDFCVDLKADVGVTKNGTAVLQYPYHGADNQKWYLVPTDDQAAFKIMSALSGKALCVKDASMNENAPVIQWTYGNDNADTNDEWTFVPVSN